MVYFPYFERQWACHRSLLRGATHTDITIVCNGGHQVHIHRAMLVTRSPLLADLLLSQECSTISLPEVLEASLILATVPSFLKVKEDTVWRLVDLLYSGSCVLPSPASAEELEEVIQQLDMEGKVNELSILEDARPPEEKEEVAIVMAVEEVVKRVTMCKKSRVKRERSLTRPPGSVSRQNVNKREENCEEVAEVGEIPAMPKDTPTCPLCGFACTSGFHLKAHLATNHFLSPLSTMVTPGGFSSTEIKSLQCDICGFNISGARALSRAVVHRATEHGALVPLLKLRLAELKQERFCRICDSFAPLRAGSEDVSLIQGSEVATRFSRDQSRAALALHLSTKHYMAQLMEAVEPGHLNCHLCDLVCMVPQVLAVHLGVCHNMALDIHDWEDERKSVQIGEETLDGNGNESVVGDGMDNGQGKEEMVAEDKCKESDLSVNDPVGEEALQEVRDISETRSPVKEKERGDVNANHERIKEKQALIEEATVNHIEVSGNLNSKVNFSSVEERCNREEIESQNDNVIKEDNGCEEMGGDGGKVDLEPETMMTEEEEPLSASALEFSSQQLFEKGGSVVWAECLGRSWFPAMLPMSPAATPISYILPFPAKPASILVQLFDSEGSWRRVGVIEPLGEDREVDEAKLRSEGNQVERRLAYGKALRYQSRQSIEMVTELELNISNCGENEKKETDDEVPKPPKGPYVPTGKPRGRPPKKSKVVEKKRSDIETDDEMPKQSEEFVAPESIKRKSKRGRSSSGSDGGSRVTRSQSVRRSR